MSTKFDFQEKVIAITGGGSGIGLALAELLASSGATIEKTGGKVLTTVLDVRDPKQVNAWIQRTVEQAGKLDGAANLAGVIPKSIGIDRVEEFDDEDWSFVLDVNLTGVMYCTRAEIGSMKPYGSIVNAASIAGVIGLARNAAYVASKHGVIGLSRSAAKEVRDRGMRVNCIAP